MALARSASGPGGLSINVGSANSFGSSNNNTGQPPASGGLFGKATMSQPTGGLFGATQPQTTQGGGGLFGAKTPTTQPAATGGMFGGLAAPAAAKPGGLFGATSTTTQPQQTSGLFGNLGVPAAQTQAPSTGGLFGSTLGQQPQQQQQPASGGLFGNIQSQAKPSLFASTATAQQPQQQTSLFGSTARPAQTAGGFGSTLPGGLTMGQPQAQQGQATVPGVRIDVSNIRITTRFNDLNEELQKQIEQADASILGIISRATECTAILPAHGESLDLIPDNVEFLQRKLIGVQANLDADVQTVSQVGKQVRVDIENAKLSFSAIENLKLPAQFHQGMWSATKQQPSTAVSKPGDPAGDLVTFFSQTAEEMDRTLTTYKDNIREIEQHLRGVERSLMQAAHNLRGNGQDGNEVEKLVGVLKDFEYGILEVASKVGGARDAVKRLELDQFRDPVYMNGNGKRTGVY